MVPQLLLRGVASSASSPCLAEIEREREREREEATSITGEKAAAAAALLAVDR